jgi:hypothetical protein
MTIFKALFAFALALTLQACQSEIDKCVNDKLNAFDAMPWGSAVTAEERKSVRLNEIADSRITCMKAAK